jgi:dipeptidyl aminopeptidase/acylaminoacyl peptidase
MVSHGYLVFTPDLYFSKNGSGPDAINSVEGAAKYLTKLHFVNTNQIAVCGHSNSGGMGYYILTHSKNFACISVGGAWTDLIGGALSIDDHGKSLIESTEKGTYGQGLGNLWNNKTKWIDGTTVLQADKVGTPLLLFHNERDGNAVQHAIEMFTALRRLDKKVWWIDYNDAGHTISGNEAKDFSIRYIQFFDHYLKGAPAPKWMTQGIPAAMKGIITGYDLDPSGSCALKGSNTCRVCQKWNEQYRRKPEIFVKPSNEWYLDPYLENEKPKLKPKSK